MNCYDKNIRQEVIKNLALDIRNQLRELVSPIYGIFYNENLNTYEIIRNISFSINELLSDELVKNRFLTLIKKDENGKLKFDTFKVIRNVIAHFPYFKAWNDVEISYDLLDWKPNKNPSMKSYFKNNEGKNIKYDIYVKINGKWELRHSVDFEIPSLVKKTNLSNYLSEDDVIWTFCLIDSLLEDLGVDIEENRYFSC